VSATDHFLCSRTTIQRHGSANTKGKTLAVNAAERKHPNQQAIVKFLYNCHIIVAPRREELAASLAGVLLAFTPCHPRG
jgi:hypothetical protein